MLTFWGGKQRRRDDLSRRDFLRVGALGLGGLTLPEILRLRASADPAGRRPRRGSPFITTASRSTTNSASP
jgi:hypothetical protein